MVGRNVSSATPPSVHRPLIHQFTHTLPSTNLFNWSSEHLHSPIVHLVFTGVVVLFIVPTLLTPPPSLHASRLYHTRSFKLFLSHSELQRHFPAFILLFFFFTLSFQDSRSPSPLRPTPHLLPLRAPIPRQTPTSSTIRNHITAQTVKPPHHETPLPIRLPPFPHPPSAHCEGLGVPHLAPVDAPSTPFT